MGPVEPHRDLCLGGHGTICNAEDPYLTCDDVIGRSTPFTHDAMRRCRAGTHSAMRSGRDWRATQSAQLRLDSFFLAEAAERIRTETEPVPGSTVHTTVSPGSRPSMAATGEGTVVRIDSDLPTALTALDSNSLAILEQNRLAALKRHDLNVRRHVGILKYSRGVGQHVGRLMADTTPRRSPRIERAARMVVRGSAVARVVGSPHLYIVPSETGRGHYLVDSGSPPLGVESCTCPDFSERLVPCKHIERVRMDVAAERDDASPPASVLTAAHATPGRDWKSYNLGQMEEGRLLHILLRDLANGFPEPQTDPTRAGRKPVPLRDQVFCAVLRSYYGFSLRRSHQFRDAATRLGMLPSPHSYTLVSHFLNRPDVTEGLHDMLARSCLPLLPLEERCAVDSTGLRTSQFNCYRREKYDPARKHSWLKLHSLVLVRSHGIPALEVSAGTANDSPFFPILLRRADATGFRFKQAFADRGYQGRPNYQAAAELGIEAVIPFKRGQTGVTKGVPPYHLAFLKFIEHRDVFDQDYGQRAQAESTFSNFKLKLTETLASRRFDSQRNEILCLAVAHNLMVVARHIVLLGLEPEFAGRFSDANTPNPAERSFGLCLNQSQSTGAVPQSAETK